MPEPEEEARPGRATRVAKLPPRERILDAAEELFHAEGIRGVGVQAVADRAGTTKAALYRHFGTKDALVAQWLLIVAADYVAAFDRVEERWPDEPLAQIRGVAAFVVDTLSTVSHRGCPFINSLAELPDRDHPARRVIETHKARQLARLTAMCAAAGLTDPEDAAAEITFVFEGAQVSVQNGSVDRVGERLVAFVEAVLVRHGA
ncbi:TetR/AcrR family transcriptional regulator [Streptomyces silvensis]|uniref:TetR family transcriptional regulator n=1 Tax=Streptomyces silvensis TaxID=1765722 RepID=A0A0W7WSN4_9ACTN|nr:TetR/AcrR family transcriptional regulator [Streptomyces silvensis]KUF13610.1 TetR family transcriptional regulator [Streptomyces silvensis]